MAVAAGAVVAAAVADAGIAEIGNIVVDFFPKFQIFSLTTPNYLL